MLIRDIYENVNEKLGKFVGEKAQKNSRKTLKYGKFPHILNLEVDKKPEKKIEKKLDKKSKNENLENLEYDKKNSISILKRINC